MWRRPNRTLVTISLLLALVLAGCGDSGGGGGDEIASAGGTAEPEDPADGGSGEDLSEEERHEMALEFAACMREHGVEMEDPEPGEGIRIQVQGDPAKVEAANEACRHLLPDGGQPPPGADEEQREQMLAFAQCMRGHGVESFEDPEPGEGIHIGAEQAEDPDFKAAEETCNEEILGGQPETAGGGR